MSMAASAARLAQLGRDGCDSDTLLVLECDLGPEGAAALSLPGLRGLATLVLERNNIQAAGAAHLRALTALTWLSCCSNDLRAAGAAHVASMRGLTSLRIRNNQLGDAGAKGLAALTTLTELDVGGNRIGPSGAVALAAGLPRLQAVFVEDNPVRRRGAKALISVPALRLMHATDAEDLDLVELQRWRPQVECHADDDPPALAEARERGWQEHMGRRWLVLACLHTTSRPPPAPGGRGLASFLHGVPEELLRVVLGFV